MNKIIDWILQNKEWLFSGVGVSVILIFWGVIRHKKESQNTKTQVVVHVHNADESTPSNYEEVSPADIERISPVNFEMIRKAIDTAPPFQRDDVQRKFIGINVEWDSYLNSANEDNDGYVKLMLKTGKDIGTGFIFCKVLLSDYKELGILPENSKIRIHGEIEEADRNHVSLKNVKLMFYVD